MSLREVCHIKERNTNSAQENNLHTTFPKCSRYNVSSSLLIQTEMQCYFKNLVHRVNNIRVPYYATVTSPVFSNNILCLVPVKEFPGNVKIMERWL